MMKYERTKGYEMVFTVFKPNFGFWANLGQQLKNPKNDNFSNWYFFVIF